MPRPSPRPRRAGNNRPPPADDGPALLNIGAAAVTIFPMDKIRLPLLAACFALLAAPAQAACYADYKAKQDDPLRLHYGVIALSDGACDDRRAASEEAARKIAAGGWTLLNIVSTFGEDGLAERKDNAGPYYLRF
ncbi:conserved hypothetical protein [Dinoroseobacter shibae DFL 12 = DSM 16493]|uniref:Uncharacterized protein n=2 Tax=Roseobacteraceae TaxID=2854170 RepID=A8LJU4_DINSH|nr:conserved hypothetical protein [Dinoroseobacter shibae DFL 12 = DSM 16493]